MGHSFTNILSYKHFEGTLHEDDNSCKVISLPEYKTVLVLILFHPCVSRVAHRQLPGQ
jgi:hypothetical protein